MAMTRLAPYCVRQGANLFKQNKETISTARRKINKTNSKKNPQTAAISPIVSPKKFNPCQQRNHTTRSTGQRAKKFNHGSFRVFCFENDRDGKKRAL